jgi:hypothetical protein
MWILWRTSMMLFLTRKSYTDNAKQAALLSYHRTQSLCVIFKYVFIAHLPTGATEHLYTVIHSPSLLMQWIKENCPKHAVSWSEVISLLKSENQSHVLSSAVSSPKRYLNIQISIVLILKQLDTYMLSFDFHFLKQNHIIQHITVHHDSSLLNDTS